MPTVPTRCLPPGELERRPGELERRPGELERRPMSLLMTEIAVAVSRLAEAGVESPRADAELLAGAPHRPAQGAPDPVGLRELHPQRLGVRRPRSGPRTPL